MDNTSWRDKDYLTTTDIAYVLGISKPTALKIARELPHISIGSRGVRRVPRMAFEKWLKDQERILMR